MTMTATTDVAVPEQDQGPVQQRARRTRERICMAAAHAFETRGFAGTVLAEVCDELGITKGALHFHFPAKQDLAVEIVRRQRAAVEAVLTQIDAADDTGLTKLVRATYALARLCTGDPIVRAGLRLSTDSAEMSGGIVGPVRQWSRWSTRHIEQARADGEVAEWVEAQALARFVVSSFAGLQTVSVALSGCTDLVERVEQMWQVVLPGILTDGHAHRLDRIRAAGERAGSGIGI